MSPKSRLRSHTTTSSRSRSNSEDAGVESWYPTNAYDDVASFTTEKLEGTAKSLLNKGSYMLRRRGSKISLSSNGSSSTLGFTSPSRTQSINASTTRRSSKDDMRIKISAPFDFQHVTHTEQTQFAGLGRIEESELASRFSTIAVQQQTAGELKGIEASEISLHSLKRDGSMNHPTVPANTEVSLHSTPPRPTPPPKDGYEQKVKALETNLATALHSPSSLSSASASFPQYLPSSITTTAEGRTLSQTAAECSPGPKQAAQAEENPLISKPLPQLPVIHAVTTDDDTARAMIAAPLPTPPDNTLPASDVDSFTNAVAHHRQKSSVALPRHYTLYPSSKSSMPNLLSADRAVMGINTLARHHSDMALSRQARDPQIPLSTRTSMSFAAVDTMDWEAAVDEAWEADDDQEFVQSAYFENTSKRNSPLVGNLSVEHSTSTGSTPLMMAQAPRSNSSVPERISPVIGSEFHKLEIVQEDECSTSLSGLGISSFLDTNTAEGSIRDSAISDAQLNRSQSSASSSRQHCLTRSSSQESVIYSLASSIMETQRSSKSSVFTGDLATRRTEDLDIVTEASGEDSDLTTNQSRIRPESGCLPSDILRQYQSTCGSAQQDVEAPVCTNVRISDDQRTKSMPQVTVPERKSSIFTSKSGRMSRARSNTVGTRPRQNSRVSYSLFPAAQQLQSTTISS